MHSERAYDHELMRALIRGVPGALEGIIDKWERPLYSFIYRYTQNEFAARDILQETFVRIYTKQDKYNFDYPLSSWVFTIAANLCKNKARWHKRHPEISIEASPSQNREGASRSMLDVLPSGEKLPVESMERDEDLDALKEAVQGLPHDLRTAVLLHHYQDLSYKEISDIVGCSIRGVETRLYRARKLLRNRMGQLRGDSDLTQKKTTQLNTGTVEGSYATALC